MTGSPPAACGIEALSSSFDRFSRRTDLLLEALSMKGRVFRNGSRTRVRTRVGHLWLTPVWQARFDIFFVEIEAGTEYERAEHAHPGTEYVITLAGEMDIRIAQGPLITESAGGMLKIPAGVVHQPEAYRGAVEQLAILDPFDPALRTPEPDNGA